MLMLSPWLQRGVGGIQIEAPPPGCEEFYETILTPEAVEFVARLHRTFDAQVSQVCNQLSGSP